MFELTSINSEIRMDNTLGIDCPKNYMFNNSCVSTGTPRRLSRDFDEGISAKIRLNSNLWKINLEYVSVKPRKLFLLLDSYYQYSIFIMMPDIMNIFVKII